MERDKFFNKKSTVIDITTPDLNKSEESNTDALGKIIKDSSDTGNYYDFIKEIYSHRYVTCYHCQITFERLKHTITIDGKEVPICYSCNNLILNKKLKEE